MIAAATATQVETTHIEATDHPVYRDFAAVVRTVIAPRAVEVDATEVPLSHVAALREVGYFSWAVPVEFGGTAVRPRSNTPRPNSCSVPAPQQRSQ